MKTDDSYKFAVSVSKDAYHSKQETNAALADGQDGKRARAAVGLKRQISYKTFTLTAQQLLESALEGHTFCTVHSDFPSNDEEHFYMYNDGYYSMSAKSSKYFSESCFIGVDIDKTEYKTPQDFIDRLSLKPTFWYTSLRNQMIDEKTGLYLGTRFRMIYIFDSPIRGKYFFRFCSSKIHKLIELETGETISDRCGLNCDQYLNGTNWNDNNYNTDYDISNIIYSFEDFDITIDEFIYYMHNHCYYKSYGNKNEIDYINRILFSRLIICNNNNNNKQTFNSLREKCIHSVEESNTKYDIHTLTDVISKIEKDYVPDINSDSNIDIDNTLIRDAETLTFAQFNEKYKNVYPIIYRKENPVWETFYDDEVGEVKYQHCCADYIELRWIANRVCDGHHRRSTLFHRCWLRRLIKPDIKPNEMFYNLMLDRDKFFDNSDHCLDVKCLIRKVQQAFEKSPESYIEEYHDIYEDTISHCRCKKIILHWTARKKTTAKGLGKLMKWQFIDLIYNRDLSLKDNLMMIQEEGVDMGLSSLYRYCNGRNIKCKNARFELFKMLHKQGLSLREELSFLEDNGLKISQKTLQNYREKLEGCRDTPIYAINALPFHLAI